ncbi:uncharacterized protein LOC144477212 isoform X1 [Augochlora pura]
MQHPPLASSGCHGLFHAWSRGRATFTSRLFAPLRLPRVFKPRLLVRSWADGPRRRAGGVRGVRAERCIAATVSKNTMARESRKAADRTNRSFQSQSRPSHRKKPPGR